MKTQVRAAESTMSATAAAAVAEAPVGTSVGVTASVTASAVASAPADRGRVDHGLLDRGPVEQSAPRWAVRVAHAIPLCTLPSGLWRVALVLGLAGDDSGYQWSAWERPYVLGLSVVAEVLALLALGLVRPWGEVVPRWVPWLRGRRIPTLAAVIPAAIGATLLTLIVVYAVLNQIFNFVQPLNDTGEGFSFSGPAAWAMWTAYAPLVAWGPLLAIVTVAYHRRRRANEALTAAPRA